MEIELGEYIIMKDEPVDDMEEKIQCKICQKIFISKKGLKYHLTTHLPEHQRPKIVCDMCGKFYITKASFLNHIYSHTDKFKCPLCDFRPGKLNLLNNHLSTHQSVTCHICKKKFKSRKLLETHLRYHPDYNFKCEHQNCEKSFLTRGELGSHLVVHQIERPFKCLITGCERAFKINKELTKHQLMHSDSRYIFNYFKNCFYSSYVGIFTY